MAAPGESLTLPPEMWKVLRPLEHCAAFLLHGVRMDGRSLLQLRSLSVKKNVLRLQQNPHLVGSAQVQLGGTVVLVAVGVLVAKVAGSELSSLDLHGNPSRDMIGDAVCTVAYDHMVSGKIEGKEPHENIVDLKHIVENFVNRGSVLDLKQLVIEEGLFVYRLTVNVTVLSANGNLRDAALMATIAALSDAHLPAAVLADDTVQIDPQQRTKLSMKPCIPMTFGYVRTTPFLDPTDKEEALCAGKATLVVNPDCSSLQYLTTVGSDVVLADLLSLCSQVALQYQAFLSAL